MVATHDDALDALRCAHDRRMRHRGLAAGASGVPCEVGHAARRCVYCAEGLSMSVGSTLDGYESSSYCFTYKSYFHL